MDEKYLVAQSNKLIQARHTKPLTAREQKIVLTMVSMIQPHDKDFKDYEISVKEFSEMLALGGSVKYTEMKGITESLMAKTIEIPTEDGGWLFANWISSAEYKVGAGVISLSFSPKLKPYMLQLKDQFTSYRLSNILNLKSAYSIRLYELMKQWQHLGRWECLVDDLKMRLGAVAKSHSVYGNFKSKALLPAIAEVNEKTDVYIKFKEIKKGRAVDRIEFSIQHLQEKEIRISTPQDKPKMKQVELDLIGKMNRIATGYSIDATAFNSVYSIASKIYQENSLEKELLALVDYANEVANKNPVGFMIYFIKTKETIYNDGGNPSIEQIEMFSSEIIPEWFSEQKRQENLKEN